MIGTFTQTFSNRWKAIATALALGALAFALFLPATGYDFINLDDKSYVFENERVYTGLTGQNIRWAFTTAHEQWYLPLLWLSFMLDVELFGTGPFGFHLTNVLLHALNVALLFWVLFRMTGSIARSAVVAALFAAHPLRVESVAWVVARKDVLSGCFFLLGLWAYLRQVEKPTGLRRAVLLMWMALGLLSKSIVVILPVVLLLLDYWPLRRAGRLWGPGAWREWRPLIAEKIPLFILAALFAGVTLATHSTGRGDAAQLSLMHRAGLIAPNYWAYLDLIFRPVGLAIMYPENDTLNGAWSLIALAGLLAVTAACLRYRSRRPYLIVGWVWFLVALFPVIRGVRLGLAAYTDRFTYLPSIGLVLALAWLVSELVPDRRWRRPALACLSLGLIAACWVGTSRYLPYWKNSETIFTRALSVTENNYLALVNLSAVRHDEGRTEEEIALLHEVLRINQRSPIPYAALGNALRSIGQLQEATEYYRLAAVYVDPLDWPIHMKIGEHFALIGRYDEALYHFQRVLDRQPGHVDTLHNAGMCHLRAGRPEQALPFFDQVLRRNPTYERSLFGKGSALVALDQPEAAIAAFQEAVDVAPDKIEFQNALAAALFKAGRSREAAVLYAELLTRQPDSPELNNNLAWLLIAVPDNGLHDPERGLEYALRAAELTHHQHASILGTLALAYAANQQFDEAIRTAELAAILAERSGLHDLTRQLKNRITQYRAGMF